MAGYNHKTIQGRSPSLLAKTKCITLKPSNKGCTGGNTNSWVWSLYSLVPRPKQPQRGSLPVSRTGKEGWGFDWG